MNIRGTPDLGQPSDDPSSGGERERIRQRMKMVIGQLEDILRELKEVAKELREVVSQIDKLTSDFDFELEPDDWTTATVSSTSSSDKAGVGGPFDLGHLDFMTADILSDSWEFCSFLDISTPSDSVDCPESTRPGAGPDYQLMNGGLPVPNGPRVETPDSSSEEAFSAGPVKGQLPQRTPGTRERVRFSDKVLYHALCCDDEEGDGEEEAAEEEGGLSPEPAHTEAPAGPLKPSPAPYKPRRSPLTGRRSGPTSVPEQTRRVTRNSSTQTVSDKSTQTVLPYTATRQKAKGKN
ncbi:inhibitory synaptic factor 1 [Bos taurus]|uniref:Inhibitory synaptic factor 1 n=1 Tax=Bos taurus TaxID=9913 RepID=INSY1_BOVIN|nr:inhibitory synaptic factor 1 [Bos taurus]A7YWL5.1 RecName: Full=Inhibitory synaptic factor 1; Short=InSyn1 [Bos taurus]AAI34649.1 MGC151651 protein [Bos taurus]